MVLSAAEFDALCDKLSANDPNTTNVAFSGYYTLPDGYGFRLGQALQQNTVVSDIALDLRSWRVDGDNGPTGTDNISMILHFLRSGPSLERVSFFRGTLDYTDACIRALSQNPSLQEFALEEVEFSPFVLAEWMESTQTLRRLVLAAAIADNDLVAAALGANSSISHLTVINYERFSNSTFLDHIARRRTATPLKELRLHCYVVNANVQAALSNLALSSSITSSLSISGAAIFTEFSAFVLALSSSRGPCMIAKLSLGNIRYNEATAAEILANVEAEISSNSANATDLATAKGATLREIVFVESYNRNTRLADISLVTALTLSARYTLERLEYHGLGGGDAVDVSLLWTKMDEQMTTTTTQTGTEGTAQLRPFYRLGVIALHRILPGNNNHDGAIFRCLPKLVSLQTLTTHPDWQRFGNGRQRSSAEAIRLAKAIRGNGSLTRVTIEDQYQWSAATVTTDLTMLTNRIDRIAVAALQRNEMLPKLLPRPTTQDGNQKDDANSVKRESRYPHLFAAALPAEYIAPHFVLMGLNAMNNYESDTLSVGKRSAPTTME